MTVARPAVPGASAESGPGAAWGARLAQGIGVSGLNPKAPLLSTALLPQFTDPADGWPTGAQSATPGLVHTVSCAVVCHCVGLTG
ncbi:hypothetical protein ACIBFB_19375 [Nocardiopsis sp. NPDC050513]|uniref:hypothetical protein n=1 Tax=Nocardiopsis sp. NPDC050513 TaxID=3364338 RepID=UPI0037AFB5F3